MLPRQPVKSPQLGFLLFPPLRVQGVSIAGEQTVVQVPELDVCFDIGQAHKAVLTSPFVALSHGHMDHVGGLPYYFSQRKFQGMGVGTVICPPALDQPIRRMMASWVDIEQQETPYNVVPLDVDHELEIKNNHFLRAIPARHPVPAQGYVVVERRSKLLPELVGLPQEKLIELKKSGRNITQMVEIPLVAYTGDTQMGEHLHRPDVLQSQLLIAECTFVDPEHRSKARVGQHLHLMDIVELLKVSQARAIILTHLSRRTHIGEIRRLMGEHVPAADRDRVFLLMDGRSNRERYDRQMEEATATRNGVDELDDEDGSGVGS
ncbi:MAG: MBL fold metallo-hydrolase [Phycisphaeraceae bacterium]|nr:MBL fold metallo-hydrolase [Phycisphaeraceae bacterium]